MLILLIFAFSIAAGCADHQAETGNEYEAVMQEITTDDLIQNLGNGEYLIVDLRDDYAYNGWETAGIAQGGHIQGAVQFPVTWLNLINGNELLHKLQEKGIVPEKHV